MILLQPVKIIRTSEDGLRQNAWFASVFGAWCDYNIRINHYVYTRPTRRHKWREVPADTRVPQDVRAELARLLAEQMPAACGVVP